jgi:hypothetical protein
MGQAGRVYGAGREGLRGRQGGFMGQAGRVYGAGREGLRGRHGGFAGQGVVGGRPAAALKMRSAGGWLGVNEQLCR